MAMHPDRVGAACTLEAFYRSSPWLLPRLWQQPGSSTATPSLGWWGRGMAPDLPVRTWTTGGELWGAGPAGSCLRCAAGNLARLLLYS